MAAAEERPIGFWLKLVDRLIDRSFDDALGEHELTRRHWQVLNSCPSTVTALDSDLAPFLAEGESVRPVVDDLTARAWIQVGAEVALTGTGTTALAKLREDVDVTRQRLMADLTPQQYAATVRVLRQMAVNLGWDENDP